MQTKQLYLTFAFLIILSLTACGPSAEQQATLTAAAWTSTPTNTATHTATATATATLTPTPTETSTPTPTASATATPTKTKAPTQTPDPSVYTAPDSSYSLVPPEGWEAQDRGAQYPILVGPTVNAFAMNLVFIQEKSSFPMAFYSATVQDSLSEALDGMETIGEEFLTTDAVQEYFRWEITSNHQDVSYRQVLYFYESGDWKLVVTYTRPDNQGAENDALVDAAMQTVRYKR